LGAEVEQIEDAQELAQVRRQARKVRMKAIAAGLLMTLLLILLP
jgi:hypothetical protein